jgi:PRC-barrel domain
MLPPSMDQLASMKARDMNGEKIGTVNDSYTDAQGPYLRHVAVKTGWFGTKCHLIPMDSRALHGRTRSASTGTTAAPTSP